MSEWKECQLGDLITFQRGHDLPKTKMQGGEYPVVGSNGIIGYHNEYTTESSSNFAVENLPAPSVSNNAFTGFENLIARSTSEFFL